MGKASLITFNGEIFVGNFSSSGDVLLIDGVNRVRYWGNHLSQGGLNGRMPREP